MTHFEYIIEKESAGERIDKYLSQINNKLSRSYIQKLIEDGEILVNGQMTKRSYKLAAGDEIKLHLPEPQESDLAARKMELDILFEDQDIIVINKPADLVVHPAPGNRGNTLVNGLLAYTDNLSGINGVKRPGIVHRLDKDTSGVIVVARNDNSHRKLVSQFKDRLTEKTYRTIVKGNLAYDQGKIDAPIGRNPHDRKKMAVTDKNSKKAVSSFRVLERFIDYTYLEVKLETGRTHQIRVHFSYLGHPILGDSKYGRQHQGVEVNRQLLHAYKLGLHHPADGRWLEFTAPLPEDFLQTLQLLRKKSKS